MTTTINEMKKTGNGLVLRELRESTLTIRNGLIRDGTEHVDDRTWAEWDAERKARAYPLGVPVNIDEMWPLKMIHFERSLSQVDARLRACENKWAELPKQPAHGLQAQIESLEAHVKKLIRQAKTVPGSLFLPFNFFNQEQFASTAQFKRWMAYYEHASPRDEEARYQLRMIFMLERIAARKRLDLGSIRAHSSSDQAPQTTTRTACPDTSGSSCCYSRRRTEARSP